MSLFKGSLLKINRRIFIDTKFNSKGSQGFQNCVSVFEIFQSIILMGSKICFHGGKCVEILFYIDSYSANSQ